MDNSIISMIFKDLLEVLRKIVVAKFESYLIVLNWDVRLRWDVRCKYCIVVRYFNGCKIKDSIKLEWVCCGRKNNKVKMHATLFKLLTNVSSIDSNILYQSWNSIYPKICKCCNALHDIYSLYILLRFIWFVNHWAVGLIFL